MSPAQRRPPPPWIHCTVRLSVGARLFRDGDSAWGAWARIRTDFPEAASAVLMPTHVHLLLPSHTGGFGYRIGGTLRAIRAQLHTDWSWDEPKITVPADFVHLRRTVRYIALKPCRDGLTSDPLAWPWSIYPGLFGAVADPWVAAASLMKVLEARGVTTGEFLEDLHAYVSSDPDVDVRGSQVPAPPRRLQPGIARLDELIVAATRCLDAPCSALKKRGHPSRRLFVHLAHGFGWQQPDLLARQLGGHRSRVFQLRAEDAPDFRPALRCLGDARLLRIPDPGARFRQKV